MQLYTSLDVGYSESTCADFVVRKSNDRSVTSMKRRGHERDMYVV